LYELHNRNSKMIRKIKLHNYVYGFTFSLLEFLLIIIVVGSLMLYYFMHGRLLDCLVTLGKVLNCAVFVLFAANSLIKKEKDLGIIKFFNKKCRTETYNRFPPLQRDTYLLSVLILLPFILILCCLIEISKMKNSE
jgi:hypothetical protein